MSRVTDSVWVPSAANEAEDPFAFRERQQELMLPRGRIFVRERGREKNERRERESSSGRRGRGRGTVAVGRRGAVAVAAPTRGRQRYSREEHSSTVEMR